MSFAVVPPAPQSPANTAVSAGAFWPSVDCNQARDALRLADIVTHERLLAELHGAMITVTGELRGWRALREADGFATLAAVDPTDLIDDQTRGEVLFIRAVRFHAAACLAELHRGIGSTNEAITRGDTEAITAADYRRLATHAIRDILGETRTVVELI